MTKPKRKTNALRASTVAKPTPSLAPQAESRRSEFLMLARILDARSVDERAFLHQMLCDFEYSGVSLQEAALERAGLAFGLSISVDEVDIYRGLGRLVAEGGWALGFVQSIFGQQGADVRLTPSTVAELIARELVDFERNLDTARKVLEEYPGEIANEIRNAVRGCK